MIGESILEKSMNGESRQRLDKAFVALTTLFFFLLPLQTRYLFREASLYEYGTLSVFLVEALGWVVIALGFMVTLEHGNTGAQMKKRYRVIGLLGFLIICW